MERLFSTEINPTLDEAEIFSILNEFRDDFNQKHFVRNDEFKKAADAIQGEQRRIFIEFLERSSMTTASFSPASILSPFTPVSLLASKGILGMYIV